MKTSEIKARIASLIGCSIGDIVLIKEKEYGNDRIEMYPDGRFIIHYANEGALVHEFLHACFSPSDEKECSKLVNAIEDERIDAVGRYYDKSLADVVVEDIEESIETINKGLTDPQARALAAMSMPSVMDPDVLLKGVDGKVADAVRKARGIIARSPDAYGFQDAYKILSPFFPNDGNDGQPNTSDGADSKFIDGISNAERTGQTTPVKKIKEDKPPKMEFKKRVLTNEMELPSTSQQIRIKKGIQDIILAKAIGKRENTTEGKLNTKRLGRRPSNYIFTKKTAPSSETRVYVLIDLSGSMMDGEKLPTVIKFLNTLRTIKTKGVSFEFRGFNALYFKNDEIACNSNDAEARNIEAYDPRTGNTGGCYNDDAHYLKVIMEEINADKAVNKVLLILSDGQPAPCHRFKENNLKEWANILEQSGIRYASVGIESEDIESNYKKSVYVEDIEKLADVMSKQIRNLIK